MRISQRTELVRHLLGTPDVFANGLIRFNKEEDTITIPVRLARRHQCRCPICGAKCPREDNGGGVRTWRCFDIGGTKTYVEACAPRVRCKKHGVVVASVTWARHNSRFAANFEDHVTWLRIKGTGSSVAKLMRISWPTVGDICKRCYDELESKSPNRFNGLTHIGIDETSYKKGHKYMTTVVDHRTGSVIWCEIGFGKAVLTKFFEMLTEEQRASIRCVSADGARWIADCISEYCPKAERCVDHFHVIAWATETLDELRRSVHKDFRKALMTELNKVMEEKGVTKEYAEARQKELKSVLRHWKGLRYALLKNPGSLTENQQVLIDFLEKSDSTLKKGYVFKEALRTAFVIKDPDGFRQVLQEWMHNVQGSKIKVFMELGEKIQRNMEGIIASVRHQLSNARIEAINNNIKLAIRQARGYRNLENLKAAVMLKCGPYEVSLSWEKVEGLTIVAKVV